LFEDIDIAFHDVDIAGKDEFLSQTETEAVAHGRDEYRRCEVLSAKSLVTHEEKWSHVRTFIRVTTERRRVKKDPETHKRLYISDIEDLSAENALAITRKHGSVENRLHGVLDIGFREDECRVYAANAAENLVVVRHLAVNLLRSVEGMSDGIASTRQEAAWTDSVRERVLCASLK